VTICCGSMSVPLPPFHIEVHCTLGSASRLNSNPNTGVNAGALQRPRPRLFGETTAGWMSRLGAYTNTSPRCERYTLAPTTGWPAQAARPCGISQCGREMKRPPPKHANRSRRTATIFPRILICKACYQRAPLFNSFVYRIYAFRPGWQGSNTFEFAIFLPASNFPASSLKFPDTYTYALSADPLPFVFTTIQTAPATPVFSQPSALRGWPPNRHHDRPDFSAIPPRTQRLCVIFSASRFSPLSLAHAHHGWPVYAVRLGNGHEVHFSA
jgi:hypothetical protein